MTKPQIHATLYDKEAPRRQINLSLNSDHLTKVRTVTPDLSATVETLLRDYLQSARQQREEEKKALDSTIDAVNWFHTRCGFMSDEFATL